MVLLIVFSGFFFLCVADRVSRVFRLVVVLIKKIEDIPDDEGRYRIKKAVFHEAKKEGCIATLDSLLINLGYKGSNDRQRNN